MRNALEQIQFPLFLQFELFHPGIDGPKKNLTLKAGFRNWDHWLAYVAQCYERNEARARHPVQINEDGTPKRNFQ